MNDPKRIDELERRFDAFEDETNHNLTMLLGQAWRHGEMLRMTKAAMLERFGRLDDRVTEAHKELAEVHLHMATKDDISGLQGNMAAVQGDIIDLKGDVAGIKAAQERQELLLQAILDRLTS